MDQKNSSTPMDTSKDDRDSSTPKPSKIAKIEEGKSSSLSKQQEELKNRVIQLHKQLVSGCGKKGCDNPDCASNPASTPLSPTDGLKRALQLVQQKNVRICIEPTLSSSIAKTPSSSLTSSSPSPVPSTTFSSLSLSLTSPTSPSPFRLADLEHLLRIGEEEAQSQREKLKTPGGPIEKEGKKDVDKEEKAPPDYKATIRAIGSAFGDSKVLNNSFLSGKANEEDPGLDVKELGSVYELVSAHAPVANAMDNAIRRLANTLSTEPPHDHQPHQLRLYPILLRNPGFNDSQSSDTFKLVCKAVSNLRPKERGILTKWFSKYPKEDLEPLVNLTQQFITLRWMTEHHAMSATLREISLAVLLLKILYEANQIAAESEPDDEHRSLRYEMFYNEAVNDEINLRDDYKRWKSPSATFSFAANPFVLDPAAKARLLQIDAAHQMAYQFEEAVMQSLFSRTSPYLILQVDRSNLIPGTLQQLQSKSSADLKKPLKIKFIGESGVDEGGLQKEYFQLIIKQIFDPDFGMFSYSEETRTYWFRGESLESTSEFELIGILLGLAIYNSVILDVQFPDIIYKKLMAHKPTLRDLKAQNPELGRGLQTLLDFKGDVEETYERTFQVTYETMLAEMKTYDLKKDGGKIPLTNENRKEYVDLYVQWALEKSIEKQFKAFATGFDLVVGGESLKLFRWEELELLICGSPELDFHALEQVTMYEEPYNADHRLIKDFWEVVHELKMEDKKRLLFFCTGSDRVPIKGLSSLQFAISRSGPDSSQLPTSHTCFNHLLLPEYSTKEKLRRSIQVAIQNSKGFGLL